MRSGNDKELGLYRKFHKLLLNTGDKCAWSASGGLMAFRDGTVAFISLEKPRAKCQKAWKEAAA